MNYLPTNDGIDHINVFSRSRVELGRKLSNFYHSPFIFKDLEFASVESLWYFIKTGQRHHFLRKLHGYPAKMEGKKLERVQFDDFNEWILEGLRCKFRQNRPLLKELAKSTLPLAHYYYFGEPDKNPKIYYLPQYQWLIDEIERIRTIAKKHYGY